MKRNSLIILLLIVFGLYGCGYFLEESSQDEVRPSTVDDLDQLLLGEGYFRKEDIVSYLELMTDNVQSSIPEGSKHIELLQRGVSVFTWQKDMYERMKEQKASNIDTWQSLYRRIKGGNVVLDMLDEVDGSEENKLNLKGQALALRAFYYFTLVNLYGQPYNAEGIDLETTPGVPLILTSTVKDEFPLRASVGAVYAQIEEDLLEALPLLEKYGKNNIRYKVTPLFVKLLLSRMYLYMENWEKAVKSASDVITESPKLVYFSDYYREMVNEWFGTVTYGYDKNAANVLDIQSPEFIWGYAKPASLQVFFLSPESFSYPGSKPAFSVSPSLVELYKETPKDLRLGFYFSQYVLNFSVGYLGGYKPDDMNDGLSPVKGMRVSEAYLNRAEANIRLFLKNGDETLKAAALADLNELRSKRIDSYVDAEIEDGEELLEFCLRERRREFAFEDHRWFDLRRLGMPELKHEVTVVKGQTQTYTLEAKSLRYVLPIAQEVLDKNPALGQNP